MKKPFYGWIIVGVAFLIGVTESGAFQAILAIFMKPMANDFGWSRAAISGSISFGSLGGAIIAPFIGPILDRDGPRVTAFWGILILSLGLIGMTFIHQIWQLYIFFSTGRMIVMGILLLVIPISVSRWFVSKRGRAMGIVWLGPFFGTATLPIVVQFFILSLGWRTAWSLLGIMVFLLSGIPVLLFLRKSPEDMGLLPDGDKPPATNRKTDSVVREDSPTQSINHTEPVWTRIQAIRTTAFWKLTAVSSLIPFIHAGINLHIYPFLTDQGIEPITAVFVLTIINTVAAFSSVGWGGLAEKIPVSSLMAVNTFTASLVFLLIFRVVLLGSTGLWGMGIFFTLVVLYGLLFGGRMMMMNLAWAQFFGRRSLGRIMGFASPFQLGANAISPIFAALFYDIYGSYAFPFYFFTACFILSGIICVSMRPPVYPE